MGFSVVLVSEIFAVFFERFFYFLSRKITGNAAPDIRNIQHPFFIHKYINLNWLGLGKKLSSILNIEKNFLKRQLFKKISKKWSVFE